MLSASESIFRVILFGAGPGLYFDLAGSIFPVPDCELAAAGETFRASATSSSVVAKAANILIRIIRPPWWNMGGQSFMCLSWQKVQRIRKAKNTEKKKVDIARAAYTSRPCKLNWFNENGPFGRHRGRHRVRLLDWLLRIAHFFSSLHTRSFAVGFYISL